LGTEPHHVVSTIALTATVQTEHRFELSDEVPKKRIWHNVFNVPKDQLRWYHELVSAIQIPVKFHLNAVTAAKDSSNDNSILKRLQGNIPDLVTFNPSLIDQEPWERVSAVQVSEDRKLAEVSLL
jgi:hypothetical protein